MQRLLSECPSHSLHGPDLAPLDYDVFGPLEEALHGLRLTSDDEPKVAVQTWIPGSPKPSSHKDASGTIQEVHRPAEGPCGEVI